MDVTCPPLVGGIPVAEQPRVNEPPRRYLTVKVPTECTACGVAFLPGVIVRVTQTSASPAVAALCPDCHATERAEDET